MIGVQKAMRMKRKKLSRGSECVNERTLLYVLEREVHAREYAGDADAHQGNVYDLEQEGAHAEQRDGLDDWGRKMHVDDDVVKQLL